MHACQVCGLGKLNWRWLILGNGMNSIDRLVEQKISEAIARGELSNLPGEGAPLELDDDSLIPEPLRMAYRVLRNAGFVPPEVLVLREIGDLERQLEHLSQNENLSRDQNLSHDDERARALRKLQYLRLRLEASGRFRYVLHSASKYSGKLLDRLQKSHDSDIVQAPKGRW